MRPINPKACGFESCKLYDTCLISRPNQGLFSIFGQINPMAMNVPRGYFTVLNVPRGYFTVLNVPRGYFTVIDFSLGVDTTNVYF